MLFFIIRRKHFTHLYVTLISILINTYMNKFINPCYSKPFLHDLLRR